MEHDALFTGRTTLLSGDAQALVYNSYNHVFRNMEFSSIDKLRIIVGSANPEPTVFFAEPADEPSDAPLVPPACFKLSPYWKSVFAFWEGYRKYRYRDSKGYWTVGIGTLIDTRKVPLSEIKKKLGKHFDSVMDGIENDPDGVIFSSGSRNGNSPMPGTRQAEVPVDLAWQWAENDIQKHFIEAYNFIGAEAWNRLTYPVQCVLVSLSYQAPIRGFKRLRAALIQNPPDYNEAANQMMSSQWYTDPRQTQPDRKIPMVSIMRSGGENIPTKIGSFTPSSPGTAKIDPCGGVNPNTPDVVSPHPWSPGFHWWE